MSFDFFTLGGGRYWEDVFFYQKWRIQRHAGTKEYRLLDPWDIRRHQGGFEDCRRAFVRFIEIYEIPRQRGHMVVMIHGIGEGKNIFKPLWRRALAQGFMAAAVNYPSSQKDIFANAKQIDFLINNLEDVSDISFVTVGAGGIVLRKLLSFNSGWQERLRLNRIAMISPPNKGCGIFAKMAESRICRKIFGTMPAELTPERIRDIPPFKKNVEFGVIYAGYPFNWLAGWLPARFQRLFLSSKDTELPGMRDKANIKNLRLNPLDNPRVCGAAMHFLAKGKFYG